MEKKFLLILFASGVLNGDTFSMDISDNRIDKAFSRSPKYFLEGSQRDEKSYHNIFCKEELENSLSAQAYFFCNLVYATKYLNSAEMRREKSNFRFRCVDIRVDDDYRSDLQTRYQLEWDKKPIGEFFGSNGLDFRVNREFVVIAGESFKKW